MWNFLVNNTTEHDKLKYFEIYLIFKWTKLYIISNSIRCHPSHLSVELLMLRIYLNTVSCVFVNDLVFSLWVADHYREFCITWRRGLHHNFYVINDVDIVHCVSFLIGQVFSISSVVTESNYFIIFLSFIVFYCFKIIFIAFFVHWI